MTTLWDLDRKPRLLVVQNDIDVGNLLRIYFTGQGAEVTMSTTGREGIALSSTEIFDLVVLDISLPDIYGYDVIKSIRAAGIKVPVFFLTQRDEQSDKLQGLELGADDYITMPFDVQELLFRVKIALRHRSDYLKAAAKNAEGEFSGHVFISYSHKDSEYTHRLAAEVEKYDIPVWIDDRIDYGTRWPQVIQEKIDTCEAFLLIMSDHSRQSEWVNNELAYAQSKGKKIYPLLLKGNVWLPVASIQYADVRNDQMPKEAFFKTLAKALS